MSESLFRLGDEVTVTIPAENREWCYNTCPDGTKATIVAFEDQYHYYRRSDARLRKPGIYKNTYPIFLLENGQRYVNTCGRITLTDEIDQERRILEWKSLPADQRESMTYHDSLPDTPFWEGDKVILKGQEAITPVTDSFRGPQYRAGHEINSQNDLQTSSELTVSIVEYIDYPKFGTEDDPRYRLYSGQNHRIPFSVSAAQLELFQRGNIWRYYNNEELLPFRSLREEVDFYSKWIYGQLEELKNPNTDNYAWTVDEILQAIEQGYAHGIKGLYGVFDVDGTVEAVRFTDGNLGQRVAEYTLKNFQS
jgi:hypothetical protein